MLKLSPNLKPQHQVTSTDVKLSTVCSAAPFAYILTLTLFNIRFIRDVLLNVYIIFLLLRY